MTEPRGEDTGKGTDGLALAVLFARTPVEGNRWIDHRWEMVGLTLAGAETTATADHVLRSSPPLELHGDEAEGYLQNVLADEPSIFFMLRPDEAAEAAGESVPPLVAAVSASFHEAARWLDGGATVERLPLPAGWKEAIEGYGRANLKPPEEKRPKRRYAASGDRHERPGH
ncbi:MAG: DUF3305 domain-containing protein [Rhodocyclaceae bacterium]|nr:DUF3305 domain-containing protein [Rhodocyclaceae bacterium]MCP5241395.1 DUF3305 domain-containing protein [Zoogloeaceae bacterium]MCP5253023.1 DUF3305 domain-containing protein [Zoogloeaceae bacterium]MCP5293288.1 DUF3305 domain-containing protein [Zoogloeaceae bacterium]